MRSRVPEITAVDGEEGSRLSLGDNRTEDTPEVSSIYLILDPPFPIIIPQHVVFLAPGCTLHCHVGATLSVLFSIAGHLLVLFVRGEPSNKDTLGTQSSLMILLAFTWRTLIALVREPLPVIISSTAMAPARATFLGITIAVVG